MQHPGCHEVADHSDAGDHGYLGPLVSAEQEGSDDGGDDAAERQRQAEAGRLRVVLGGGSEILVRNLHALCFELADDAVQHLDVRGAVA